MDRAKEIFEKILKDGEKAIDNFILDKQSEELFLDFKRSSDNGTGRKLHDDDRKNYAKAISGFGNSEGGVIVWGVDCSKDPTGADIPKMKVHLSDVYKFVSFLEGATSGCTIPPHNLVENKAVATNNNEGFVISYIPKSLNIPHQTLIHKHQNFYIRAGSNFEQIPYQVLAGMFGRRPNPSLRLELYSDDKPKIGNEDRIEFTTYFLITNIGLGIATNLFFTVSRETPGRYSEIFIKPIYDKSWEDYGGRVTNKLSMVTKIDVRLAPQASLKLFSIEFYLKPPFDKKQIIEGIIGCENCPPIRFYYESGEYIIEEQYKNILGPLKQKKSFNHMVEIAKLINFKNMEA